MKYGRTKGKGDYGGGKFIFKENKLQINSNFSFLVSSSRHTLILSSQWKSSLIRSSCLTMRTDSASKSKLIHPQKSEHSCDPEKCRFFEQSNVKLTILCLLGDSNRSQKLTSQHHQARHLSNLFTSSHLFRGYCRSTTIRFQAGTSTMTQ